MNSTKKFIFGTIVSLGLVSVAMADGTNQLTDEKSRVSYAIGMMLGHNWQQQGLDIDVDIAASAIKTVQSGGQALMTPEQVQQTLASFQKEFAAKQQQKRAEQSVKNKTDGDAFLAANKSKPGVESLPDGLQYQVLTTGAGAVPSIADTVTVNYRGTLLDGTEFDSSYKRGQPASFPVGGIIKGWNEALQLMPVGSKWELYIPPDLAYGARGAGQNIGPNSALIFEVELISIQPKAPPAPAPAVSPAAAPTASPTSKP